MFSEADLTNSNSLALVQKAGRAAGCHLCPHFPLLPQGSPEILGMQARKRYEERLVEDMASPFWQLSVGDAPPILRLPWELLVYIVEILVGDRAHDDMKAVRSLRW